jgi:starch-binding outer membrane protein, SusD/RagB family
MFLTKKPYIVASLMGAALLIGGCDKQLEEPKPQASVDNAVAITNAANTEVALVGAYDILNSANYLGNQVTYFGDLPADATFQSGTFPSLFEMDNNALLTNNANTTNAWTTIYNGINRANNIIDRVPTMVDPALEATVNNVKVRDRILGEALFLRAFHYFTLVRFWGGVPLVLKGTTGIDPSAQVARNTEAECYTRILADLTQAETLLPVTYPAAADARGRATRGAVQALLSRVYLTQRSWQNAADKAGAVLANTTQYRLATPFSSIFTTKNSTESIFEVQFNPTDQNGITFHYLQAPQGRRENAPSTTVINAFTASAGDTRFAASIGRTGAATAPLTQGNAVVLKYNRPATQDDPIYVFRLAEMHLNRAEALAELAYPSTEALSLLNAVRVRAGVAPLTQTQVATVADFRLAIERERLLEFCFEGHRWHDLKRTGRAQAVLGISDATKLLFPIPQRDRDANPNLAQNPGY